MESRANKMPYITPNESLMIEIWLHRKSIATIRNYKHELKGFLEWLEKHSKYTGAEKPSGKQVNIIALVDIVAKVFAKPIKFFTVF